MDDSDAVDLPVTARDPTVTVDRRRAGRVEYDNPALIELLRQPSSGPRDYETPTDANDGQNFVRGIIIGVLLAVPMWGAIGFAAWFLLGR